MRYRILHVFVQLRIRLIEAVRLEDWVPPEVVWTSRSYNLAISLPLEYFGVAPGTSGIGKSAKGIAAFILVGIWSGMEEQNQLD